MLDLDIQVEKRYELIRQGSKDDTVELNINFKTIIYKFLKELMLANELEPEEYSKID